MTLIDCQSPSGALPAKPMENSPWQVRLKRAGLSQKTLAQLLGVAENTVSQQLRGKWQSGIPRYVKAVIWAWERLPQKDREAMLDASGEDYHA